MVKKIISVFLFVAIGIAAYKSFIPTKSNELPLPPATTNDDSSPITSATDQPADIPLSETVMTGLDTPWSIVFMPDRRILVTERHGTVRIGSEIIATIESVYEIGEGGLMGAALDPDFSKNQHIYFYYTYTGRGDNTLNRVVRMTFINNRLTDEKIIVDAIPGAANHNGGRIKFGPDGYLYVTTGDAQTPSRAQDKNSLSGKILKVSVSGKTEIYSFGHRNPQGLAWNDSGVLYATEHGRSGIQSGLDEFNRIEPGKNYGWPDIEGDEKRTGMESPIIHSGSFSTWAPAGLAYLDGAFYFGGLRGSALYRVIIDDDGAKVTEHLKGEFGRIRDVVVGPDNMIYISTSNLDGRGLPKKNDDRIVRINPNKL